MSTNDDGTHGEGQIELEERYGNGNGFPTFLPILTNNGVIVHMIQIYDHSEKDLSSPKQQQPQQQQQYTVCADGDGFSSEVFT